MKQKSIFAVCFALRLTICTFLMGIASTTVFADPVFKGFDWEMAPRFGLDTNQNGLVDLPNSKEYVLNHSCPCPSGCDLPIFATTLKIDVEWSNTGQGVSFENWISMKAQGLSTPGSRVRMRAIEETTGGMSPHRSSIYVTPPNGLNQSKTTNFQLKPTQNRFDTIFTQPGQDIMPARTSALALVQLSPLQTIDVLEGLPSTEAGTMAAEFDSHQAMQIIAALDQSKRLAHPPHFLEEWYKNEQIRLPVWVRFNVRGVNTGVQAIETVRASEASFCLPEDDYEVAVGTLQGDLDADDSKNNWFIANYHFKVDDILVVVVGDSYAAGEGNPEARVSDDFEYDLEASGAAALQASLEKEITSRFWQCSAYSAPTEESINYLAHVRANELLSDIKWHRDCQGSGGVALSKL